MKKLLFAFMLFSFTIISACSDSDEKNNSQPEKDLPSQENQQQEEQQTPEKQNEKPATNGNNDNTVASITQAEALKNIKDQLKTNLPIYLPAKLPIPEGAFLTATTKAEDQQVEIIFYESEQYLPINDIKLKNPESATVLARLTVKQYGSTKEANEQIAFENFSKNGGQEVDLSNKIKGYQDAGVGSLWTGWNEGRWAIATHTRTDNPDAGIKLAKQAVQFLETHMLPIPKQNGSAHLDVYKTGNLIVWQDETLVYTLDTIKDPLKALEIATAFYH
ncbi:MULTISPECIES: hypothetical protein [Lysinibacillus]|uniref:hypothetical protein n=1 Tax=Lysinibacillus TaxID=400634 RepID=UPI00257B831E|nr:MULTISPECIES: hypothetical protein [Lysinibacillus]